MKNPLSILLCLMCTALCAQVFPVQVSPQLTPPYSPYLSDYTATGARHLAVHVRANDMALSDYACRIRLTIEGAGITLRTKESFSPPPLILEGGGLPQIIYGDDLREYFHPDALDFFGLSRAAYEKSPRLPEGVYRFNIEVLDYHRGTVVSNKGMAMAWILLNAPPLLNLPRNLATVSVADPVNILFTWTPRHTASPNAAFTTEYTFRLVEVWPENRNPYDAFLTSIPLYEHTTGDNRLLYGPGEPALIPGRSYAWQVEARDTGGKDLFKNNGRSEVFVFRFGEPLGVPANLRLRWAKPTTLAILWDAVQTSGPEEVKYRLAYRPRQRRPDRQWHETRTRFTDKTLYHLEPNLEYEVRVRAEAGARESEYTDTQIFKTLRPEEKVFVCGDAKPPPAPDQTVPVFPLSINDTIHAGGYEVLVRDVMEVKGRYHGSGFAIVPWFNYAKIRVSFENIRVNDRFWLTSGSIKSYWNPESGFLLEEQTAVAPGEAPKAGALDITIIAADSLMAIGEAAIASVTRDEEGNVVVITTDGKEAVLTPGTSYAVVDSTGSGYVIDSQGNVAKTTAREARAAAARGTRRYDHAFAFVKGDGRFGFDEKKFEALSPHYQQLDDGTPVAWKALSTSVSDIIEGHPASGDVDAAGLRFAVMGGQPQPFTVSDPGSVQLRLQGKAAGLEEELLAIYQPSDTVPGKVVGKVNLVTYNPVRYSLVIVPVNGVVVPRGISAGRLAEHLNGVFSQAVVEWNVSISEGISVPLEEPFDDGETGILTNYTDDMKKVLRAWGRLEAGTYYLFLVDEPRSAATLGYMPRSRQAGFVFVAPHKGNAEEFLKTVAHELGHGAFNLKHTFSEYNLPSGTTDNLMDYSSGTALCKYQWDLIHSPPLVVGLFEGGEEVAMGDYTDVYLLTWWKNLPPYKKAAEILRQHLEATEVYESVRSECDTNKCTIASDLKIGPDINATMEVTLLSTMSADELLLMLMFEYRVDLWVASDVRSEDKWDDLYHWWRKQNDDLAQQKGWQVSTLNFLADVITAPTMVPAVQGWITGKHYRDGHQLSGWEQALAALDFLVAEEIAKGCITNFVVRIGTRSVNLLSLNEGMKSLIRKAIEQGLKFSVVADNEIIILTKEGKEAGRIVDNILTIRYSKFGGDISCHPEKTTTVIGRFIDAVDGDGISVIKENKLYRYGENPGGVNILDEANWTWEANENWLKQAAARSDEIRLISDPAKLENLYIFKNGSRTSDLTTFGKELKLLDALGYTQDGVLMVKKK